jgi:hypothetical protein
MISIHDFHMLFTIINQQGTSWRQHQVSQQTITKQFAKGHQQQKHTELNPEKPSGQTEWIPDDGEPGKQ